MLKYSLSHMQKTKLMYAPTVDIARPDILLDVPYSTEKSKADEWAEYSLIMG